MKAIAMKKHLNLFVGLSSLISGVLFTIYSVEINALHHAEIKNGGVSLILVGLIGLVCYGYELSKLNMEDL